MLKRIMACLLVSAMAVSLCAKKFAPAPTGITVKDVYLTGTINDRSADLSVKVKLKTSSAANIVLLRGKVVASDRINVDSSALSFWKSSPEGKIVFKDDTYYLECSGAGEYEVTLPFYAKVNASGMRRECEFLLPNGLFRKFELKIAAGNADCEILKAMALPQNKKALYSGVLPTTGAVEMKWIKTLDNQKQLLSYGVVSGGVCAVQAGGAKIDTLYSFEIFQGKLANINFKVPAGVNILQVSGENLRSWDFDPKKRLLNATLSQEQERRYKLKISSSQFLPKIPGVIELKPLVPENAIKYDGYLRIGTGSGIKLLVKDASGLVQIDNSSLDWKSFPPSQLRLNNPLSYSFAGGQYCFKGEVEAIQPVYSSVINCIMDYRDRSLRVMLNCELDIKDAPLREIKLKYDNDLNFNRVDGAAVNSEDYDLLKIKGQKFLRIPFRRPVSGKQRFTIRFEREMKDLKNISLPKFNLEGATAVRGYLLLAAERGVKLEPDKTSNLIPVHPGAVPLRTAGLQYAFLFRSLDWSGKVKIIHEKSTIFAEAFQLVSAAEGTVYGCSIFSLQISGAPVQVLRFAVSDTYRNLEFKGRNIINRRKIGAGEKGWNLWEVRFRDKVLGAVTLMVSYEISADKKGQVILGAVSCKSAVASSGYIAMTGMKSMKISVPGKSKTVQEIDSAELPSEYLNMLTTPLLKAFRCSGANAVREAVISHYPKSTLPETVIDRAKLETRVDSNGGAVTTAEYRIKNSTGQFLKIELAKGCNLWSVKIDGKRKRLSASNGKILIPLPRYRNINRPIKVEVTYAQNVGKLKNSTELRLASPGTGLKQLYSKWDVNVPEKYSITDSDPAAINRSDYFGGGMTGVISRASRILYRWLENGPLAAWGGLIIFVCIFIWSMKKRRYVLVGLIGLLGTLFFGGMGFGMLSAHSLFPPDTGKIIMNSAAFSQVMNLGDKPFELTLQVSNLQAASFWSWLLSAGGVILGIASIAAAVIIKRKFIRCALVGIGLTLFAAVASQWFASGVYASLAIAVIIPLGIALGVWTLVWKRTVKTAAILLAGIMVIGSTVNAGTVKGQISDFNCTAKVANKYVQYKLTYKLRADKPGTMMILSAPAIITKSDLPSDCELERSNGNYLVKMKSSGKFTLMLEAIVPIIRKQDIMSFGIQVPVCLRNTISLSAPDSLTLKVHGAVWEQIKRDKGQLNFTGKFLPGKYAGFELRRLGVKTDTEKVKFFVKTLGYLKIGRGSTEYQDNIELTVPQGGLKSVTLEVPELMRVTSASGDNVEGWRFDRSKKLLHLYFSRPVNGSASISVFYQVPDSRLPRTISFTPPVVRDTVRQNGSVGVFAGNGVRVSEDSLKGFSPIDSTYFSKQRPASFGILKKAYRYSGTACELKLEASAVKPEVRIVEDTVINCEDERTSINSRLRLNIVKGGIFSFSLKLPDGFELNRLTGSMVQHWNQFKRNGARTVVINFRQRVSGSTTLDLELISMKGLKQGVQTVPSLRMPDADKVTGSLMISVEKGVSVSTVSRYGITMERGGFKRVKRNMIGFKILRSDWKLSLKFEVTPAWVQLSTLQKLKVRESDIECEAFLRFNIENAGIKRFRIKLPENSYGPEFEGRFISSAGPIKDNIWEIRLNRKIERSYKMKISCRLKKADETSFIILPFKVEEAAVQTGYLALFAEDSLQLALGEKQGDITSFNARNIPSSFGAKDLASAILCYRSVGTGWRAKLNIVRHKGAATLKTTIESLLLKTLAINSNMVINEVNISLSNDGAAFLPLKLPEKSVLWAAFMDTRPVQVVTSGKDLLVPLKQSSDGNCKQQIRIVYSSLASSGWNKKNRVYTGPEIPLPLRNIRWELYAPEDNSYSSFDGTLNYRDELLTSLAAATLREYDEKAVSLVKTVTGNARKFLNIGNKYYKLGRSRQAMEAFQKAIDISGDTALKSDIQGQLIRNSRMNNIMNIAQRQQAFSGSQVSQVKQAPQMQKYKNLQALKDQLGSEEFQILQAISDRIFTQQQAALTIPRQFDVAIPWQGKRIAFERALEINENAPLKVEFKARSKADISSMLPGPLSFIGLAIILTLTGLLFLSPAKPKFE